MEKTTSLFLISLVCIAAVLIMGCTSTGGYQAPQITQAPTTAAAPDLVVTTAPPVPVSTSQTAFIITTADQPMGTLTLTAAAFSGKANVSVDGTDVGVLTQGPPFSTKIVAGSHVLKLCIGGVCDNENIQINSAKTTTLDLGAKLVDLLANSKPSAKIVMTQPAGHQVIVNVDFNNPTQDDLTMIATVQVTYAYNNNGGAQGRSAASGIAKVDVPAGGKSTGTATIQLATDLGDTYVSGIPTMTDFTFVKTVKSN